jgi:cystathionine gamma-synthase
MEAPLDRSATWPYEDGQPGRFSYARADHPTGVACEEALGALDGGYALLYPSGMAAVTTVVLTMLRPGGTIALAEGAYYGHRTLLDHLAPWGVRVREFDQTGTPPDDVDLILVEAPANPILTMPDLEAAAAHPAPVVCDATIASPLRLRPLEHGCDVALHSATKILSGHDDVLAGVTVTRDEALRDRLHQTRRLAGMVAPADTAWLVLRGLVERLEAHPAVVTVRYPGFSFLVSFDVADGGAAGRVERAVRTIVNATSLGGTRSKLEARHRWEGDRIPTGLLRLSVGLEDADALWADLEQALAVA